jgi:type IV pilus assembly protein PilQ
MKIMNMLICKALNLFVVICLLFFAAPPGITAQGPRSISMDFQEAKLKDVLKVFSQQAGLNFVATENIEDKNITLYLDNVTVNDALHSIMSANNLTYEQAQGSAVFIVKELGRPRIEMATKVYALDFASLGRIDQDSINESSDIKSVIESLLSKDPEGETMGRVVVDKRTNSLIITAIPTDFPVIEDTLGKLDSITPQALIEAEIVEIHTGALKSLGLEWGASDGTFVRFTGPKKLTHFPFVRSHNPLSKGLLSITESSDGSSGETEAASELGVLSLQEFSLVIKALESEGMARYLAKPRIMSLSNEPAEIKITADTVIGVIVSDVTDTGRVIEEAERIETGVTLKVTPTVNRKGYITMTIEPEVSRVAQSPYFSQFVDPARRSAKTTVMVKDGQTIAIGGLLKTEEEDQGRDVPGLSRIPLLGNLFRSKEKRNVQTEIIVFITAHAILDTKDMVQTAKALQDYEKEGPYLDEQTPADTREAEIQKTVMRLRRKRELERNR